MKKFFFTFLLFFFCAFLLAPGLVRAASSADEQLAKNTCKAEGGYYLKIPLFPETTVDLDGTPTKIGGRCIKSIAEYVVLIYELGLGILALLALIMIIVGGFQYLASRGNSSQMSEAKDRITQALLGLILGLCSWLILYVVNPSLVNLRWEEESLKTVIRKSQTKVNEDQNTAKYENCQDGAGNKMDTVKIDGQWYEVTGPAGGVQKCVESELSAGCKQAYMTPGQSTTGCEDYKKFKKIGTTVTPVSFQDILSTCGSYIDTQINNCKNDIICVGLPCLMVDGSRASCVYTPPVNGVGGVVQCQ